MKIPDVEEWPRDLVKVLEDTIEYTFDGFILYIKTFRPAGTQYI